MNDKLNNLLNPSWMGSIVPSFDTMSGIVASTSVQEMLLGTSAPKFAQENTLGINALTSQRDSLLETLASNFAQENTLGINALASQQDSLLETLASKFAQENTLGINALTSQRDSLLETLASNFAQENTLGINALASQQDSLLETLASNFAQENTLGINALASQQDSLLETLASNFAQENTLGINALASQQDSLLETLASNFAQENTLGINALASQQDSLLETLASNFAQENTLGINALTSQRDSLLETLASNFAQESLFGNGALAFAQKDLQKLNSASQFVKQLGRLSSFKVLEIFNGSPFSKLGVDLYKNNNSKEENSVIFLEDDILKTDQEVSEELDSCNDFELLSDNAKKILIYIYHIYFIPLLYIFISIAITTLYAEKITEKLSVFTTSLEIRRFTKNTSSSFDRSLLKNYRVTIKENLSLREYPLLKLEEIENIPIGTLVKVIKGKKVGKSWLFVEIEINDQVIEGWILRRYTTYFK